MGMESNGQSQAAGDKAAKTNEDVVAQDKSRRRLLLFAVTGAALVLLAAIIAGVAVFGDSGRRIQEQLDLGTKYLEEMDYERALAAFNTVLSIEPQNADAYLGIVEVYMRANENESALEYAREGYEVTGDERLKEKVDMMESAGEEKADKLKAVSSELQTGTEKKDEEMLSNLNFPRLNKFLSVFAYNRLGEYSSENPNYLDLLYFVKVYLTNNDYEKIRHEGYYDIISKEDVDGLLELYFDLEIPDESIGEILCSNNSFYFQASDFGELGFGFSILEDIQEAGTGEYAATFYEVYALPEDFESGEWNPVASDWSTYYGYDIEQIREDKYCEITAKKRCTLKWQDDRFILTEYGTVDDLTAGNVTEENVVDYVYEGVPELRDYASYISANSNGQASLTMYLEGEEDRAVDNGGVEHFCYVIYVGESWSDHNVNWDRFYVDRESMQIYWYDFLEDIVYDLEDWRKSTWYRQL